MPPTMKRLAYHVWLAPEGHDGDPLALPDDQLEYHHVLVGNADQLRAELEAGRLKLKQQDNPMHLTNLWLWSALVRTKVVNVKFQEFKSRLVSYDPDKDRDQPHTDPDADLDDLDADPTEASSG